MKIQKGLPHNLSNGHPPKSIKRTNRSGGKIDLPIQALETLVLHNLLANVHHEPVELNKN